eukprot:5430849-Prymnesium_polylepis.3
MDAERSVNLCGGEARFLRRKGRLFVPEGGDGAAFRVGEDGWAEGWRDEVEEVLGLLEWDEHGWAVIEGMLRGTFAQ